MLELVCAEFDEFEEALYGVQGRYVLRSSQQRDWRLRIVDLNGVALMTGREGAGTVYSGIGLPGYFNIFVPLSAHLSTVVDGQRFDRSKIGWMSPDVMFHIDASQPGSWLTVAMASELVLRRAESHADEFDYSMLSRNLVSSARNGLAPLIWLARRLFQADARSPGQLHTPAAEWAARMELMDAVFRALPVRTGRESLSRGLDHKRVLRNALNLLESLDSMTVFTEDLCTATRVSERTLRNVFNRYLGMSPHRYLMVHRLHAIRSAIRRAQPGETLTTLCARFGVWDFGRFSRQYREHFGVLPSEALYGRPHRHAGGKWATVKTVE